MYKELEYVGQLNPLFLTNRVALEFTLKKQPSFLREIDPEVWRKWNDRIESKYFWNTPTVKALDISEMKIDEERPWPLNDKFKKVAISYVDKILEVPLTHKEWTDEEVYDHLELDKTPAFPWRIMGYRTRKDLFESPEWADIKDNIEALTEIGHIYKSTPKEEWSAMADYHANKTRTFLIPGAHVLFWQIKLFGQGNENLKKWVWSQYGLNPFSGNVNKMAKEMLLEDEQGERLYPIVVFWDVNGYDRKISLHDVAERRYRRWMAANPMSSNGKFARWIADGLKRSIVIFANGDICWRLRGNNSGSGMTTANNIEAGFEVVTDLLICAYYRKYQEMPTFELIYKQLVKLYGDDNASALMKQFEYMLDEPFLTDRLLNGHGLKLKLMSGGRETPLNEVSFLGFNFHLFEGKWWIPKWNLDRLLVPLVYSKERLRLDIFLQRFYAILILSFAHEEWAEIRCVYAKVLQWASDNNGQPAVKALIRLGIPTYDEMKYFYLGLESGVVWPILEHTKMNTQKKVNTVGDYDPMNNYKGKLQELCMAQGLKTPEYVHTVTGPSHCPTFLTVTLFQGEKFTVYSASKKEGEQRVAHRILSQIPVEMVPKKYVLERAPPPIEEFNSLTLTDDILNQFNERAQKYSRESEKVNVDRQEKAQEGFDVEEEKRKTQMRNQMFFFNFLVQYRSYLDLTPEQRLYHPLAKLFAMGDKKASEWLSRMIIDGTFDPYGNGQMAKRSQDNGKYYLMKPGVVQVGELFICSSTCLVPGSVNITGQGSTAGEAFQNWLDQVVGYINVWEPPVKGPLYDMFKVMRAQGKPTGVTEYCYLWDDDEKIAYLKMWTEFKEGGFNPYGNGQTEEELIKDICRIKPKIAGMRVVYMSSNPTSMFESEVAERNARINREENIRRINEGLQRENTFIEELREHERLDEQFNLRFPKEKPPPYISYGNVDDTVCKNPVLKEKYFAEGSYNPYGNGMIESQWIKLFMEGGYNPYGNGMIMGKKQWIDINSKMLMGRDKQFIEKKYQNYVKKAGKSPNQIVRKEMKQVMNPKPYNNFKKDKRPQPGGQKKNFKKGYDGGRVKVSLSGCAKGYATAQMCPFFFKDGSCASRVPKSVSMKELPCVPSFPTVKSRKMTCWADFEMGFSNTGGVAWCAAAPWRLANNESNTDDVSPSILYSGAWGANTTAEFPTFDQGSESYPGGWGMMNSDYTTEQLVTTSTGVGIRYRPVGFGLRIRYIGALMQAAGMIHGGVQPDHTSLAGIQLDQFAQYETYFTRQVSSVADGKWVELTFNPVNSADLEYARDTVANATWNSEPFKNHFMGFIVTGAPAGASFQGQIFGIYEVEGAEVRGKTISVSDVVGTSAVLNSIGPDLQNKNNSNVPVKTLLQKGIQDITAVTGTKSENLAGDVAKLGAELTSLLI